MRALCPRLALIGLLVVPFATAAPDDPKAEAAKAALQALNDFIGTWNGTGGPDKPRPDPKDPTWKETIDWSWRFQGGDAWITFAVKNGKHLQGGDVRYLPEKKVYQLTATDAKGQKQVYEGTLDKKGYLTFERTDGGETQQLVMNVAGDGVRFVYRVAHKPKGRTAFTKDYLVAASKEGESLGAVEKKNECVVTGGLGKIPVTYMGVTYYVCCTGCRDEFNANPAKILKEWEEKKKAK
jgi:hypothetical protein